MNLKIKDIINITNGNLLIGNLNEECQNYSKDTRDIKKDDTYIGIKGQNFNGNLFWEDALKNGAKAVIIEETKIEEEKIKKYKNLNKNIIIVKDTSKALIQIATEKRKKYGKNLYVIGVTGSVGKTSTKDIIASVVSKKYKTLKTQGNNNNDIGLPFTILRLKDEQVAVIEMGMNHLREISLLTEIAKPDLAVITNIGSSHIGNLGSRENILKAKLEILEGMENKKIVINNDNDLLYKWQEQEESKIEIHKFGIENKSECSAIDIIEKEDKSEFTCLYLNEKFKIKVPVAGKVFIQNALCAILIGKLLNIDNKEIQEGISEFELTKKRMDIIKINNINIINDAYNASFESMKAGIEYLSNIEKGRKIAVLGDMFELGEFSEKLHKKVGKQVAINNIDILFTIGENAKFIQNEAIKEGIKKKNTYYFENKNNLFEELIKIIKPYDNILIKASNGMKLFEIADKLKDKLNNENAV